MLVDKDECKGVCKRGGRGGAMSGVDERSALLGGGGAMSGVDERSALLGVETVAYM